MNEIEILQNSEPKVLPSPDTEIHIDAPFSYDGYQVVRGEFFAHLFEPSVTLNDEKVSVNSACIRKLPNTNYVQFLVNPNEKKLAVKPCSEDTKDSFCWSTIGTDGKKRPKTISCRIFFAKVMQLMGWNPNCRYKILGKLIHAGSESIFVFDLTSAETFQKRNNNGNNPSRRALYPDAELGDYLGAARREYCRHLHSHLRRLLRKLVQETRQALRPDAETGSGATGRHA